MDKVDGWSCVIYSELSQKGTGETIISLVYSFINLTDIFSAYHVSGTALCIWKTAAKKKK